MRFKYTSKKIHKCYSIILLTLFLFSSGTFTQTVWASEPTPVTAEKDILITYDGFAEQLISCARNRVPDKYGVIETDIILNINEITNFMKYCMVYFLGPNLKLSYMETEKPDMVKIYIRTENLDDSLYQNEKALEELKRIADEANELKQSEKIKYFAEYLRNNMAYDYTYENKTSYQLLVNKKGICHGFSQSFFWLCRFSNIECKYILGETNKGILHAWNEVKSDDGCWHAIDVTNLRQELYLSNNIYEAYYRKAKEIN